MKPISLNDVVRWSPWPARLLGAAPWSVPDRVVEKVDHEYDKNKYARCREFYNATTPLPDPEAVKRFEFEAAPESALCISIGDELFEASLQEARQQAAALLVETLRPVLADCRTVVEYGCGYGYNLWTLSQHFPGLTFRGGDYSANAVELAAGLYRQTPRIRVARFNFYDESTYVMLDDAPGPVVAFTCHALEQLPSAVAFIDSLAKHRRNIRDVFHFEPVVQLHEESLLALMRRRYVEANDYNRDLLSALQARSFVRIVETRGDVVGLNPFNPTSVIHWQFVP
jgi:hypothetical protein